MYMIISDGELLFCPMFWVRVSFKSACISSPFLSIALMFHSSYYVHDILRGWVVVLSHVLSMCLLWKCIYFFSFLSIALMFHSSYYVHDILRRWVVVLSHVLSIYFFWECMYFFSFPIHCPNVPLVVLCTWYSQRVSCCLVPCFEYVFLLRVHVFLLLSYPLP